MKPIKRWTNMTVVLKRQLPVNQNIGGHIMFVLSQHGDILKGWRADDPSPAPKIFHFPVSAIERRYVPIPCSGDVVMNGTIIHTALALNERPARRRRAS